MKTKLAVLIIFIWGASSANAEPLLRLGQSLKSFSMAGVGVSMPYDEDAFFINPAGLAANDETWFEAPVNVSYSGMSMTEIVEAYTKLSSPDSVGILGFGEAFAGKRLNLNFSTTPHFVGHLPGYNFSFGAVAFLDMSLDVSAAEVQSTIDPAILALLPPDQQALLNNGLFDLAGNYTLNIGGVMSLAFPLFDEQLLLGTSFRYIVRRYGQIDLDANAIVQKQLAGELGGLSSLFNAASLNGFSFDAGLLWRMPFLPSIRPQLGMSILNIANTKLRGASNNIPERYTKFPQEILVGMSIKPFHSWIFSARLAVEYHDMLNNVTNDSSILKRFRIGTELSLLRMSIGINESVQYLISLRAGYGENLFSFGAELAIFHFLTFQYVQYGVEHGSKPGDDPRRYSGLSLAVGF